MSSLRSRNAIQVRFQIGGNHIILTYISYALSIPIYVCVQAADPYPNAIDRNPALLIVVVPGSIQASSIHEVSFSIALVVVVFAIAATAVGDRCEWIPPCPARVDDPPSVS